MVMIGIIVCNKIFMYSSFKLHFVYTVPFQPEREDDEFKSGYHHHLLFPVQLDAARQLDGAGAVTHLQHRYRLGDAGAGHRRIFTIDIDGQQIWERKQDGGFPDAAELKRRVRDVCFPEKALGHVDKPANPT